MGIRPIDNVARGSATEIVGSKIKRNGREVLDIVDEEISPREEAERMERARMIKPMKCRILLSQMHMHQQC